jgi:hypothetical protein
MSRRAHYAPQRVAGKVVSHILPNPVFACIGRQVLTRRLVKIIRLLKTWFSLPVKAIVRGMAAVTY